MEKTEATNLGNVSRVLKGSLFSIVITLATLFIFAIVLTYTNVEEKLMFPVTVGITMVSICVTSLGMARKIKKNGIVYGGIIRLYCYVSTIHII